MSPTEIGFRLLNIIFAILSKTKSTEEIATDLIDLAFESGIAPAVLMQHLTERGRLTAEAIADIAQWAKLKKLGGPVFLNDPPFGKEEP